MWKQNVSKPEIDVLVTSYNQSRWIKEAVGSVVTQDFRRDFNIYIHDDKSSDHGLWGLKNEGFDIEISRVNEGVSAARNRVAQRGNAEWILFLDGDDRLSPHFLELLWRRARITGADIVYPKIAIFQEAGLAEHGSVNQCEFNRLTLLRQNYLPVTSLVKRSVFQALSGFDEMMKDGFEDWEFWIRAALRNYKFKFEPKASLFYRHHDQSRSREANKRIDIVRSYIETKHSKDFKRIFKPRVEVIGESGTE